MNVWKIEKYFYGQVMTQPAPRNGFVGADHDLTPPTNRFAILEFYLTFLFSR